MATTISRIRIQDRLHASKKKKSTMFHIVARHDLSHVLSLLLRVDDTEVDSKDDDARTPLSWAAAEGHEAVVQLLIPRKRSDISTHAVVVSGKARTSGSS